MSESNREKGRQNLERLQEWLNAAEGIPERNGKANISAIGAASKIDRQVLYRPEAKAMIQKAVEEKGLGLPDQQRTLTNEAPVWATRRIQQLETQLAVARAEIADLRERARTVEAVEAHMISTGILPR